MIISWFGDFRRKKNDISENNCNISGEKDTHKKKKNASNDAFYLLIQIVKKNIYCIKSQSFRFGEQNNVSGSQMKKLILWPIAVYIY